MILSDKTIIELLDDNELLIDPIDRDLQIQPSSVDLRLGNEILVYTNYRIDVIDVKDKNYTDKVEKMLIDDKGYILQPKTFVLATTFEYIRLPNYLTGFVEGRSSLGRLGLFIENAGWVDAGFEGNITLELYNANTVPIRIYPNMRICQIVIAKMTTDALRPYRGKYQGQRGVTGSMSYLDNENK